MKKLQADKLVEVINALPEVESYDGLEYTIEIYPDIDINFKVKDGNNVVTFFKRRGMNGKHFWILEI